MPAIDYSGQAAVFRRRRTLPSTVLDAWRTAVAPRLAGASHVLDVGAGTGQFCAPLAAWAGDGTRVTALEPSAAMRAELMASGVGGHERMRLVAARGEALPLASRSADAAWLSTVAHQFDDPDAALAELARVLRPGGRVLVRNYLADQGRIGLMGLFPGIERSIARFPSTAELVARADRQGLALVDAIEVDEVWRWDLRAWADAMAEVRHGDSMLVPLTDDEVATGLAAVRAEGACRPGVQDVHLPLRLVTFSRPV
jgi:SAM-dependent methyltransferase